APHESLRSGRCFTMSTCMIKVCGITNLDDALVAVDGGATAIGFNFYPKSKRYIAPEDAASIAAAIPKSVAKAGVFVNESPAAIEKIAETVGLDVAQLHGDEADDQTPRALRVWKAFRVDERFDTLAFNGFPSAEAFLLDGPAGTDFGGSGKP